YFWGPDLSGTFDGAGGVGGLLAVSFNGSFYFPVYDNNGNVMKYVDESGDVVASYIYDDFGKIVLKIGTLADTFSFRFSTKYFDRETNLIAYQLRYYKPEDRGWISRDPIGGDGRLQVGKPLPLSGPTASVRAFARVRRVARNYGETTWRLPIF
ncbi:MAG: hypothetical protein PUE68_00320, partial [Kiritimatiellae bacterium]|nr:hypothetical protein [Kiritimatiellia bacterium]